MIVVMRLMLEKLNLKSIGGESKLLGEQAIQAIDIPHYIFRTSWVFANRGNNFVLTMIRLMQEHKKLRIVNDQFGSPTWSRTIAEITSQILAQPNKLSDASGIYNLTSDGRTSWSDFAKAIYATAPELETVTDLVIEGIPTKEYPTPAVRPLNSELSTAKLSGTFGLTLPDWKDALTLCLNRQ